MVNDKLLGHSVLRFSQPLEKQSIPFYPGETELQTETETLGFSRLGWRTLVGSRLGRTSETLGFSRLEWRALVGSRLGRNGIGLSRLRIMTQF